MFGAIRFVACLEVIVMQRDIRSCCLVAALSNDVAFRIAAATRRCATVLRGDTKGLIEWTGQQWRGSGL